MFKAQIRRGLRAKQALGYEVLRTELPNAHKRMIYNDKVPENPVTSYPASSRGRKGDGVFRDAAPQ